MTGVSNNWLQQVKPFEIVGLAFKGYPLGHFRRLIEYDYHFVFLVLEKVLIIRNQLRLLCEPRMLIWWILNNDYGCEL
jgi:hypothetical protein